MIGELNSRRHILRPTARKKEPLSRTGLQAPLQPGGSSTAPGPTRSAARSSPSPSFGVATYNLAAGNDEFGTAANFERTKRLAAQEIVGGSSSVMAFQEVGINGRNTRGRDNNEQILEEVFRQELPRGFRDADISKVSLHPNGQPVTRDGQPVYDPERYADSRYTARSEGGDTRHMTLTRDRFDREGREVPFDTPAGDAPTVHYSAHLEEEDKTYNLAYASNNQHGSYGNSVLLAPGYEIEDSQQKVLGHDPDGEQRSALAVTFRTPDGQEATAISAHLSNGSSQQQGEARLPQLRELSRFADDYQNALIMGDYNTDPGRAYGENVWDHLPFVDPDRTPSAESFGFDDPDPDSDSIDRIFTQDGDVGVRNRHEVERSAGGSDHSMITWDVTLRALRDNYALAS